MAAPYHVYDSGTGAAQAAHFIRAVKAAGYDAKRPGQLQPVVDLEKVDGRCPAGVNSTQVAAFLTKTKEAFGVNPIVYASKDFTDSCLNGKTSALANSPLWIPRYRSGTTEPAPHQHARHDQDLARAEDRIPGHRRPHRPAPAERRRPPHHDRRRLRPRDHYGG
ncbi:putative glycosyl transferase [Streptomyces venezuelae]|nr:putative glycosyl transferase [Streptomyces venezuelae]CUM35646.1 hypothetical protein BN2537_257 [Streptomyces venezuelae]